MGAAVWLADGGLSLPETADAIADLGLRITAWKVRTGARGVIPILSGFLLKNPALLAR